MADSIRLRLADAAAAALALASVTINSAVRTKPTGLTVHRFRNRPVLSDNLPALVLSLDSDTKPVRDATDRVDRILNLVVEHRVKVSAGTAPDDAVDPLVKWAVFALFANETLGGLASHIEEGETVWEPAEAGQTFMRAATRFAVHYITLANDPEAQS